MKKMRPPLILLVIAVSALGFVFGSTAISQEKAPAAVAVDQPAILISTSNIERFLTRILYLMRTVEQNEVGGMASMMVNMYSRGLDRNRPVAVAMTINASGNPDPAILLPVSDLKGFFAGLTAFGEPEDLGNDLFTMDIAGRPVFMKKNNDWLVVSQLESIAENFKTIPEELIKGLSNDYEIGVRLDVKSIPSEQMDALFGMMKDSFERTARQQQASLERSLERAKSQSPDSDDVKDIDGELANLKLGLEYQRLQSDELEKSLRNISQLVFGLYIDPSDKQVGIDVAIDFLPGSVHAKRLEKTSSTASSLRELPTNNSAVIFNATDSWDAEQISMYEKTANLFFDVGFERLLKDNDIKLDSSIKSELKQLVLDNIRAGVSDTSATVSFDDALNAIAGFRVADGKKLEKLVKQLAAAGDPQVGLETKFNAYKHKDSDIHLGSIKLPDLNGATLNKRMQGTPLADAAPVLSKMFGDKMQFAIATAGTQVTVGIGPMAEDNVKSALDRLGGQSSLPKRPMEMRIETLPIFQFAQSVSSNAITDAMTKAAQNASDSDMIVIDTRIHGNSFISRLAIEEGVLRAIGAAIKTGTNKQRGGF
jgi:hypothetical protein